MLTTARDLRRHLIRMENEQYHARHTGDPEHRLQWLNIYVQMLRIRLQRAEERENGAA
jgi:hypothetical protein